MGRDHAGETGGGDDRLPALRRVPAAFDVRVVTVLPGRRLRYHAHEWEDALVMVERGAIELESDSGATWCFECGAVLWLTGLGIYALHNRCHESAVLIAVSRRRSSRVRRTMPR